MQSVIPHYQMSSIDVDPGTKSALYGSNVQAYIG